MKTWEALGNLGCRVPHLCPLQQQHLPCRQIALRNRKAGHIRALVNVQKFGVFSVLLLHSDSEAMNTHVSRSWGAFQSWRLGHHRLGAVPTQIIIFCFLNLPRCFSWLQPCFSSFFLFYFFRGKRGGVLCKPLADRKEKVNAMSALVTYTTMDLWEPAHGAGFRGQEKGIRESKGPTSEMRQLCHETLWDHGHTGASFL